MKFLCVPCNEPMKLQEVEGPDQGSLAVVFHCPQCAHRIALLTNPAETQMVKALDVKIGGEPAPADPLSFTRASLASQREDTFSTEKIKETVEAAKDAGGCPFAAVVREAEAKAEGEDLVWTEGADRRLQRIPIFVRPSVKRAIEGFAREKGHQTITEAVMDEAREEIGI
ncbi:MAG: PCP reductase family protein [Candidatus Methylomirabilales bacterium]